MMTDTGGRTGGIPAGRNSYSNSSEDPIVECGCTARTLTLITIFFKCLGLGLLFHLSHAMSSGVSAARTGIEAGYQSPHPEVDQFRLQALEFLWPALFWSTFPLFFFYFVGLVGVVREIICLIVVYGICTVLEAVAGLICILFLYLGLQAPIISCFPFIGLFLFNTLAIRAAGKFLKRVRFRQASPLESQSTPTVLYSA